MNTWYCTVCGLGFGFRTELAWHVRENHLSHPQEWAKLASHGFSRGVARDWARLHQLQSVVDYPAISLLMGTIPSPTMTPLAAARLRLLAQQARGRLVQELHGRALPEIEERLTRAVAVAERGATDDGLAVFVSPHHVAVVPLPFRPHERVIVDTMFATRDVLDALQRYPGYRVLVLGTACFRILEGRARHLKEVAAWQAPTVLPGWMLPKLEAGHTDPDGHINLRERPELVLSEADRALDKRVGLEAPPPTDRGRATPVPRALRATLGPLGKRCGRGPGPRFHRLSAGRRRSGRAADRRLVCPEREQGAGRAGPGGPRRQSSLGT